MDRLEQPCPRDCKSRAAGCAVTCQIWQEYERKKFARYKTTMEEKSADPQHYFGEKSARWKAFHARKRSQK